MAILVWGLSKIRLSRSTWPDRQLNSTPPVEVEVLVRLGAFDLPGGRFLPKSRSLFYFWLYNRGWREDSTWPDRGSTFSCQDHPPAQNPPGLPNGRLLPGGYWSRWPVSHQVGPGGPRWVFWPPTWSIWPGQKKLPNKPLVADQRKSIDVIWYDMIWNDLAYRIDKDWLDFRLPCHRWI